MTATAVLIQAPPDSAVGFAAYGRMRDFWRYQGPEAMLEGPYQTGKTICALQKLNALLAKYAGARALMVRKTYTSLVNSAVVTYETKVLPYPPGHPRCAVDRYGGSKPEWYDYPNGSRLVLGGLDKPEKFLSGEYDFIYVNQAEELTLNDWELLTARATGRAGNAPYAQVLADCNPDVPEHWIKHRPTLKSFTTVHRDNPTLFDPETGEQTALGQQTMLRLDALTGVRRKRGRDGLWVGREGMVYEEYSADVHLIDRFEIPDDWDRYRCIDFGYRNPFVCQWWAVDEDGRAYRYREIYMTGRTVRQHAEQIKRLSGGERYRATIADHDAEDRATLAEHGISTRAADKDVLVGIDKVKERLTVQGDGKARLYFMRDSLVEVDPTLRDQFKPTCTEEEFPAYVFPDTRANRADDERPVKVDDHGMDTTRYFVMHLDNRRPLAIARAG